MTADDDEFSSRLAALDDELAAGITTPAMPTGETPVTLRRRLERGLAALHVLNDLRPQRLDPASAASPTQLGRFAIRRELGRGGFGVVFLAHDPTLDRDIALKVPHASALMIDELRARFRREAQAAAGLDHPNIVPVYEVGEVGPVCYIASAYCPGPNLAEWLARHPLAPAADAAALVATLADAVAHAHARGVLHRDLKPSNILLSRKSETRNPTSEQRPDADFELRITDFDPKVSDFGLAKLIDDPDPVTRSQATLGTPAYMAPEQARGQARALGPAADIYALGAILYELLTGRPPFRGETDLETVQQTAELEPVPPRQLRPRVPRDLNTICLKCLEKDPAKRYARAADLAADLRRFLDGRPILARPVGPVGRLARWCRRRPAVAGLAFALGAAVLLGVGGVYREWRRAEREGEVAVAEQGRNARLFRDADAALQKMIAAGDAYTHDYAHVAQGRDILEIARGYYRNLRREDPASAELRRKSALVCTRLAILYSEINQAAEFEPALAEAVELYEAQIAAEPDDRESRLRLVRLLWQAIRVFTYTQDSRRAFAGVETVLGHVRRMRADSPQEVELVMWHAAMHLIRGELRFTDDDLPGAAADYRAAADVYRGLPRDRWPLDFDAAMALVQARRAVMLLGLGDLPAAEVEAAEALTLGATLQSRGPLAPEPSLFRGDTRLAAAAVAAARGRTEEALGMLQQAADDLVPVVRKSQLPGALWALRTHFRVARERATILHRAGRRAEATAVLTAALQVRSKAHPGGLAKLPPLPEHLECSTRLAENLLADGDAAAARAAWAVAADLIMEVPAPSRAYSRAVAAVRALARTFPSAGPPARP